VIVARVFSPIAANPVFFRLVVLVLGLMNVCNILKCTKSWSLRFQSNIDLIAIGVEYAPKFRQPPRTSSGERGRSRR